MINKIYKTLSHIDGGYITEAAEYKRPHKLIIAVIAAALIAATVFSAVLIANRITGTTEIPVIIGNRTAAPGVAYCGEDIDGYASSGGAAAEVADDGLCVLLKPVSVSKDLYKFYGNVKGEYYLALFEVKKVYRSTCTVGSFYVVVPKDYYVDFTRYDEIVCYNLHQIALDRFVIYNVTEEKAEMLMLPLFGDYNPYGSAVDLYASRYYAYSGGELDTSLWDTNEKWKAWWRDESREYALEHYATVKAAEKELTADKDKYSYRTVNTLDGIEDEDAKRLLSYVSDFDNGVFVSNMHYNYMFANSLSKVFTRYINGYPTDERYGFYIYLQEQNAAEKKVENVSFADNVFTDEDIEIMPDLGTVLSEVYNQAEEGRIKPPHLQAGTEPTAMKCGVYGWYSKSDGKVYSVIRVGFAFQLEGDKAWQYRIDDQYYIYENGKLMSVTRDSLLELIPDCPYVYTGEYVENGRMMEFVEY